MKAIDQSKTNLSEIKNSESKCVQDNQEEQPIDAKKEQQLQQYKTDLEQLKTKQTILEQQLCKHHEYRQTQSATILDFIER